MRVIILHSPLYSIIPNKGFIQCKKRGVIPPLFCFGNINRPSVYYRTILGVFVDAGELEIEEIHFKEGTGELYRSLQKPDLTIFSDDELEILLEIKRKFKDWNSMQISEFSHQEKAYKESKEGELISYFLAS